MTPSMERDGPEAPPPLPLLGMGLIATATLLLQISLTRIFSLLIWYHFAFLAISLALLGFTAGGVIVFIRPSLTDARLPLRSAWLSAGFAASCLAALLVACRLPFERSVLDDARQFLSFLALIAVVVLPFVLSGIVIAGNLVAHVRRAGRLYFADLLGSGLGCLVSVPVLDRLGGGAGGMLAAGLAATAAGIAFARRAPAERRRLGGALAGIAAALLAALAVAHDPLRDPFYLPNAKIYPKVPREWILERRCGSLACVDFVENPVHLGIWGLAKTYTGAPPDQIGVVIDAWAITSIFGASSDPRIYEALPPTLVHRVRRELGAPTRTMLVIGAGGGVDVRSALHFGAERVEAAEIDGIIVDAVRGRWDGFSGGLYRKPEVAVSVAEGRHYLRGSSKRYDVVQLSGVDTFAATQAGAFALSENYLYTVEAMKEYLEHLEPGGILTMTRWLYDPERQTIRLAVIADRAMREMGLDAASSRMVVVSVRTGEGQEGFSVILFRREPFTPEELATIRRLAESDGFEMAWSPDGKVPPNAFTAYFAAADKDRFVAAYPYRIDANTDDRPFFFEYNKLSRILSSRDHFFGAAGGMTLLFVTLALVLAAGAPLTWLARRGPREASAPPPRMAPPWIAYFLALGLGFIAIETVLVSRFILYLGHPVYALSVILCALLIASGAGSFASERLVGGSPKRLAACLAAVAVLLAAYRLVLGPVFAGTLGAALPARIALTAALVAVPGFLMGTAFPSGLARAPDGAGRGSWVSFAWALNGYASVAGTVVAMVVAIEWGFTAVLLLGAACYAVACVVALRAPSPERIGAR